MTYERSNFDRSLDAIEMQFAADDIASANDGADTSATTELQIASARQIQENPSSSILDRLSAHLDENDAYETRIKALADASRLDWELSRLLDE
jgi:hypothetical protein